MRELIAVMRRKCSRLLTYVSRHSVALYRPRVLALGAFDGEHARAGYLQPRCGTTALRAQKRENDSLGVWHSALHGGGLVKLLGQTQVRQVQKVTRRGSYSKRPT